MAGSDRIDFWIDRIEKIGARDEKFFRAYIIVDDGSVRFEWPITLPYQVSGYGEAQDEAWKHFHQITSRLAEVTKKHGSP